jgi:hypothetical protein
MALDGDTTAGSPRQADLSQAIALSIIDSLHQSGARGVTPPLSTAPSWQAFANALGVLIAANPALERRIEETVARTARLSLAARDVAVPSVDEFITALRTPVAARGGTVVRAFWWGFHIQISHQDLQTFLASADPINAAIGAIGGGIPSPAAPFIALAAAFVAGALGLLRSLDRGSGVYVSMSWFAPGVFVPTSV